MLMYETNVDLDLNLADFHLFGEYGLVFEFVNSAQPDLDWV